MSIKETMDKATAFAEKHAVELAKNIEELHSTSVLPPDCAMRHLSEIISHALGYERLAVAEAISNTAIRKQFIKEHA